VERPPRTVEYICLTCGTQGSIHTEADGDDPTRKGGSSLKCPRCGSIVLHLERKAAAEFFEAAIPVEKP
jgi:DNA-directed RNA polymerase subunit RPC12/RpoP